MVGQITKLEKGTGIKVTVVIEKHQESNFDNEYFAACNRCVRSVATFVPGEEHATELAAIHMSHYH